MPRGGYPAALLLAYLAPKLRAYPVSLTLSPGHQLIVDLRERVSFPLFRWGHYPHQLLADEVVRSCLHDGDCVWDIGANIGYTALVYATAVGPTGRVVALEPGRRSFRLLRQATAGIRQIECLNVAAGELDGRLGFKEARRLDLSHISDASDYWVQSVTLDRLLESAGSPPNLIKLDVEGYESRVLSGARHLIRTHVPMIAFEALNEKAFSSFWSLLTQIGEGTYRAFVPTHLDRAAEVATWSAASCDYIALPEQYVHRLRI